MWWEYAIIFACLGAAVWYCLWLLGRAFSGKGGACGSSGCGGCAEAEEGAADDRQVKVVPLVQLRPPGE